MKIRSAIFIPAVVAALCGPMASGATFVWNNPDVSLTSMAFTPAHLLILSDGSITPLDVNTGVPGAPFATPKVDRIGNTDAGEAWGCRYNTSSPTEPLLIIAEISPDGTVGAEHTISTAQLEPAAYNGVKEHTFGPVAVAGSIADGSATVAFVERVVANNQALTESLRLWRIYGCFDSAAAPSARYSDLCVIDQYPYVTIFPEVNTQVVLANLTCSFTDNSCDVPYFYTSRSATQQVKQRLTAPVLPDAGLTGIHMATIADDTYFIYASKPGEVVLTLIDDPAEGFAADNIHYVSTLSMDVAYADTPHRGEVNIATATFDGQLAIALYAEGRALTLYRHSADNNGLGATVADAQQPYHITGQTIVAYEALDIYDLAGHRLRKLQSDDAATLPTGTYVLRSLYGAEVVALR